MCIHPLLLMAWGIVNGLAPLLHFTGDCYGELSGLGLGNISLLRPLRRLAQAGIAKRPDNAAYYVCQGESDLSSITEFPSPPYPGSPSDHTGSWRGIPWELGFSYQRQ